MKTPAGVRRKASVNASSRWRTPSQHVRVGAGVERGHEAVGERAAHEAVGAVGADDQVGVGQRAHVADVGAEPDLDAQIEGPMAEETHERLAGNPRGRRALHRHALAAVHHVEPVPHDGVPQERVEDRLIGVAQQGEGRLGERDAPAERLVFRVTLEDGDPVVGRLLLEQDGEVEAAGTAADDHSLHAPTRGDEGRAVRASAGAALRCRGPGRALRTRDRSEPTCRCLEEGDAHSKPAAGSRQAGGGPADP